MEEPVKLPKTMACSAKERLSQIVKGHKIKSYRIITSFEPLQYLVGGECRTYKDGFEAVSSLNHTEAFLHLDDKERNNGIIVFYNMLF